MKSSPINKTYRVTIEFEVTLDQVRDYAELPQKEIDRLVEEQLDQQELIGDAAHHLGRELMHYHEEKDSVYFDYLDFSVNSYKIKTIEE